MTDGLFGQWYDDYIFLRAVGTSSVTDQNCYYLVDGLVIAATVDATNHVTEIYQTEFDKTGFELEYQERPTPLYVTTTVEELTKVYLGKELRDY